MDDLLYVLIGIAWVAYSLYSARQKAIKKQQAAGMPPKGPSQSSPLPIPGNESGGKTLFEDIFRELTGESRPAPHVPQPVPYTAPVQMDKKAATNITSISSSGYSSVSDFPSYFPQNDTENTRKMTENEGQILKNESEIRKFDLREAVILSELLNRKYF